MQRRNNFKIKFLSVIIPAYKQEKSIVKDIRNIVKVLDSLKYDYEVIVVVDGLVDKTYKKVLRLKSRKIKIIAYKENQGKGHAVRFGMLHAKGDVIGFIDAGMDINPAGFTMLLNHMEWYNAEIIVGSKLHPVSKVDYPLYRTVLSMGYRWLTSSLFGFRIRDTQVGIKFFRRNVIRKVLPKLVVKRYAFDIEILAVSYALGHKRIFEAPVEINFKAATINSKNMWRTILLMLVDTVNVYYRLKVSRFYHKRVSRKNLADLKQVTIIDGIAQSQWKLYKEIPNKQPKKSTSGRYLLTR